MDQETKLEIGVGALGVGLFILALVLIATQLGDGSLSSQAGIALIGVICGFVVVMTGLGYWLSGRRS